MTHNVPLFELCRPKQWPTLSRAEFEPNGQYPVYGANGVIGKSTKYTHEKPTVMIGCRGSVGIVHLSEPYSYINGNAMALDDLDGSICHAEYLARYLRWRGFDDVTSGSSQPQITQENLKRVSVPIPDLETQLVISKKLELAEKAVQKQLEQLELLRELEKSTFDSNFSEELEENIRALGEIVDPDTVITYGIVQAGPHLDEGVPYIRPVDIKDGRIILDQLLMTSPEIAGKFERSKVRGGDIVITIRATLGTTAIVPDSLAGANLNRGTAKISSGKSINNIYLKAYIDSQFGQSWFESRAKGATIRGLNLEELRKMPIPVPSMERQIAFASKMEHIWNLRRETETRLPVAKELYSSIEGFYFRGTT